MDNNEYSLLKSIYDYKRITGPIRIKREFPFGQQYSKYSSFYMDIMYLSQTISSKLWKLGDKLFHRYTSGNGMAAVICCSDPCSGMDWVGKLLSAAGIQPSAVSHFQGFLSGREQPCPKPYVFPGRTASNKWLSQEYKGLAPCPKYGQPWRIIFSLELPTGIPPRQDCSLTCPSAQFCLLPFHFTVEDPKSTL